MKNKKLLIILGLTLLLIVGGFAFTKFKSGKSVNKETSGEQSGLFASVKDALSQKLTLTCEFTDETGATTKSYIKNGAVRVSAVSGSDQASEIIIKDKKMYMWDDKKKEGFVYTVPDESGDNQTDVSNQDIVSSEAYLDMIDKYKDSCKVANLADSYFTIPTDVNFQDMSKLLEDLQKQMPQIKIPSE